MIALITGLAAAFAVAATLDAVQRDREAVEADGTVVKRWKKHKTRYADVVFTTAAGTRVRASLSKGDWTSLPKVGARVRVRYLPTDPADGVTDARQGRISRYRMPILHWAVVVAFAIASGWSQRQSVKDRRRD
ncbi:hypothetical protein HNR61_007550 [Actinomadura namibiensis]|uniref:DUF3592 domain-containing protein n=1 Tax=Actinomadura namibiensis TaxID=182080 RepID=A0A7W3LX04_ACTNM|nr:DUF3592 domain-containing protein [Actinomadura namibiensis]MBA8955868.1 hypothetical protein [Actinomadura namibiensis]